ncbi:MAG: hypothetical protein VX519_09825 [Myxococcota bacterium]|nr:hypothetical protein [Myxococcota bacterium]
MTMLALLASMATTAPVLAEEDYDISLDGHYRVRIHDHHGLFHPKGSSNYLTHQLRLQPTLDFEGRAKFIMMADALDSVVWGDNMSKASTALFAGNPSNTDIEGQPVSDFQVKRAWMEFSVPVGLLRVGRQPSHWGMGLLANEGTHFDDTFGENNYGSTYDRIIFATRPVAVAQTLLGQKASDLPLFMAIGIDRLVEDPLIQYYGYNCTAEGPDDAGDDPQCNDSAIPYEDEEHDYTEDRDPSERTENWWAENEDDVFEIVYVLIYKGKDLQWGSNLADFTAGAYAVHRLQKESLSDVWIYDAYINLALKNLRVEAEALTIQGETDNIVLAGGDPDNPLHKETNIVGTVGRVGYENPNVTLMMEAGYASGDGDIADVEMTGRPLHPDYNVGLLLYEEVLARATADAWSEDVRGLWSKGGVYNSRYIYPNVRWRPLNGWQLSLAYLAAFPDRPDGSIILKGSEDETSQGEPVSDSKLLGTEIDVGLQIEFANHMNFSMEWARAQITDRVPYVVELGGEDRSLWTLQTRIAYVF